MTKRKGKRRAGAPKPKSINLGEMRGVLAASDDPEKREVARVLDLEMETRAGLNRHYRGQYDAVMGSDPAAEMLYAQDIGAMPPGELLQTTFRDEFRRRIDREDVSIASVERLVDQALGGVDSEPEDQIAVRSLARTMDMAKRSGIGNERGPGTIWGPGGFDPKVGAAMGLTDTEMHLEEAISQMDVALLAGYVEDGRIAQLIEAQTLLRGSPHQREAGLALGLEICVEGYNVAKTRLAELGKQKDELEDDYARVMGQLMMLTQQNGGRASELDVLVALGLR